MIEEGTVQPTAAALDSKVMALNAVNARALSAVQNLAVNTINTAGVKVLETTVVDGKVTFTLEKQVKKFSIVVDGTTAQNVEKENSITSPQTGSNTAAVCSAKRRASDNKAERATPTGAALFYSRIIYNMVISHNNGA